MKDIIKAVLSFANGKKRWSGFFIIILSVAIHFANGSPETVEALQTVIEYLKTPEGATAVAGIMTFIVGLFDWARKKTEKV